MRLHFELVQRADVGGSVPLVVLHGLFGSSRNWRTVGSRLSERMSTKVYLMDMRNHGKSPFSSDDSFLDEYASDVVETMELEKHSKLDLIGHSMGGLVGMILALNNPQRVRKLVVEDVSPSWSQVKTRTDRYFEVMQNVNESEITDRKSVREMLLKEEKNERIVDFLLMNVRKEGEKYYKFDLPLRSLQSDSYNAKRYEWQKYSSVDVSALFLKGEKSEYIDTEGFDRSKILFPNASLKEISGCGHWIHSEKPEEFISAVSEFLKD